MDVEFHYWITALVAYRAGFSQEETKVIAYASEFVDENDVCLEVVDKSSGEKYGNFISQTMNILKPKRELMRVYPLFHFVPGEPDAYTARRRDGKMHILNTTPNSENANEFLQAAFKSTEDLRLYRIGIATHCYVDTWAHQNFVGWYDAFNNIGLDPKPDIGHADGEHHPDWVAHSWVDSRLVDGDINNSLRFLSAAKALFENYCDYLSTYKGQPNNRANWPALEKELIQLFGTPYTGNRKVREYAKARMRGYKEALPWLDDFDEKIWFDAAIETDVNMFDDSDDGIFSTLSFSIFKDDYYWREDIDKEASQWFKFQEAVKEHERFGLDLMADLFKQMDVDIRRA